ncbi:hypothetical protein NIES46_38200 [Arthrospira platensis NIES-46]|mgnify:CR=1 FL=1|jgi:hypothetical protein|uniref:Uncharacterized protein n=1 Tax=Limnospira platensis NIES-46 TaxID=1236695 RepID=A0A5M3T8D6_LIMPL|nr:hypothetical protein [Arthrospira platensis]GCE95754.1 hypothetical protein NIES46_38200 [Arthrospira platensis NIES-46]
MIFNWFFKDSSGEDKTISHQEEERILTQFKKLSPRLLGLPEIQTIITFKEVISYFNSDRPADYGIKQGLIIREAHSEGQLIAQVFLDRNNQFICRPDGTPYGRQLVTKELDRELAKTFGNRNLFFVKLKGKSAPDYQLDGSAFSKVNDWWRDLVKIPEVIPLITYEDAIKYFVSDRPRDPRVNRGAILRKPHPQGYHIIQMFLDENNELVCDSFGKPYGRQLVAKRLDEELHDYFGDKDLILVL